MCGLIFYDRTPVQRTYKEEMQRKTNKYRNKRIKNAFGSFDSIKEWKWYCLLLDRQKRGEISKLQRQVKFLLIPTQRDDKGKVIERECSYIADFVYTEKGYQHSLDVKSEITRKNHEYIIKRKLMLFLHGIRIEEV